MVGVFAGIPGQTRAELLTAAPQPAQLTVTDDVAIHTVTHATVEARHGGGMGRSADTRVHGSPRYTNTCEQEHIYGLVRKNASSLQNNNGLIS